MSIRTSQVLLYRLGWLPLFAACVPAAFAQTPAAEPAPELISSPPPEGAIGGMGDINLYPKRLVMSDRERTASIGLYNRAASMGEYEISIGDMLMGEDGSLVHLETVTDPAARARVNPASSFLKWSPRRVALPANEAVMVRIMARIPPDLPAGEYRSHFSVISVPPVDDARTLEEATGEAPGGGMSVTIRPRFGITIPVILRVGETTLTAGLTGFALIGLGNGEQALSVTITRAGNRSAFGDITVTAPGVRKPVAEIKGVGVYTEIASRTVLVPFDSELTSGRIAPGTRLTVTYTDDDYAPGKILARQEFVVP